MAEGPYNISGHDYHISVTGRSTDNLTGYDETILAVQPKSNGFGYIIVALYTDRHVNGSVKRLRNPVANPLQFPADTAFYELFFKSERSDFTALLIGARTPVQLAQRIDYLRMRGNSASCKALGFTMCVAIPNDNGVTSLISVTVNGSEILTRRGALVSDAIRMAGEPQPGTLIRRLKVYKAWHGRSTAVTFDPADDAILSLCLEGGEIISWH